jgi:flagellar basal body rod protein FlgC
MDKSLAPAFAGSALKRQRGRTNMSATIIRFETKAQQEDRLYREAMAAFDDHAAAHTRATLESLLRALERLVAAQGSRQPPPFVRSA